MSECWDVLLVGAFVRVGWLRLRQGLSAIQGGFVEIMVASDLGCQPRGWTFVEGRLGFTPGGFRPMRLVSLHGAFWDAHFLVRLTWGCRT